MKTGQIIEKAQEYSGLLSIYFLFRGHGRFRTCPPKFRGSSNYGTQIPTLGSWRLCLSAGGAEWQETCGGSMPYFMWSFCLMLALCPHSMVSDSETPGECLGHEASARVFFRALPGP